MDNVIICVHRNPLVRLSFRALSMYYISNLVPTMTAALDHCQNQWSVIYHSPNDFITIYAAIVRDEELRPISFG